MPSLFALYNKLQKFAENDGIVLFNFIEKESEWEIKQGAEPSDPKMWSVFYMEEFGKRVPTWVRYVGNGDETNATAKLVSDYEYYRGNLGAPDYDNASAKDVKATSKVGLYALLDAALLSVATRLPWYYGIIYMILAIFLWVYSGKGGKTASTILWIMRAVALGSIVAILIRVL